METAKDGGPAFPFLGEYVSAHGMTLRDYFAAAALAGGLEQGVEDDMGAATPNSDAWWHRPEKLARRAYAIADAMLKERHE